MAAWEDVVFLREVLCHRLKDEVAARAAADAAGAAASLQGMLDLRRETFRVAGVSCLRQGVLYVASRYMKRLEHLNREVCA